MSEKDITDRSDIELLVSDFYKKALIDPVIGYFFTKVIVLDLDVHLPRIIDFWCSLLLGHSSFKGNPMVKHIALNRIEKITDQHFNRWLSLWNLTVEEHFRGPQATEAMKRADQIAGLMKHKINIDEML
ncbi:MAG: group III truncated hemoglobin [Saprospiraceae bacterium]|nr:group III truncated hemoglobin [Saprospiraceae bacterium]